MANSDSPLSPELDDDGGPPGGEPADDSASISSAGDSGTDLPGGSQQGDPANDDVADPAPGGMQPPASPPFHVPTFAPQPAPRGDNRARREAALLAQGGDLEKDGKAQEHHRHQSFRNHINRALIIIFWIIAITIMIGIGVYAWHVIMPDKYKFLTEKGFDKLQTLLGAIVLSSALSGYVKQRME